MARNERQEDDGRGGVSTITRPGVRPRPASRSRPPAEPRPGARLRPGAQPGPGAGAIPNVRTAPQPQPQPGASRGRPPAVAPPGTHRLPFVLLLCGLLGGALISALVISTTLAAGSFEISKLENSTTAQTKQLQSLQEQVAQAQSPPQIASRAAELGMRPVGQLRFVDLKTGKLTTDATDWQAYVPPGYTP
jgi:hypothetical protein